MASGTVWPIVVVAALSGIVLALILLLLQASRQRDDVLAAQERSNRIVELALSIDVAVARSDAALGRHALALSSTEDLAHRREWRVAGERIRQLGRLVADEPDQAARADALAGAYARRDRRLAEVTRSIGDGQGAMARTRYVAIDDRGGEDRLGPRIAAIVTAEKALLASRIGDVRRAARTVNRLIAIVGGLGAIAALGAIGGIVLLLRAIATRRTERQAALAEAQRSHRLEEAVRTRTAELESANRQLIAEAHERAEAEARLTQSQKMEAIGQLTGGIAHDFNNMLAVIVGGIELATRRLEAAPDRARHHLESAMDAARRAAALTRRLLAFARAEPILPEGVAPGAVVAEFRDLIDRTLGDRIALDVVRSDRDWRVWVDRHQLENCLLNLAVNARDAMDGAGTLTIATDVRVLPADGDGVLEGGDHVAISVTDTGCGMAPDVLSRVFEPFFTTKPVGHGTGLGLAQVFAFARAAHGDVRIDSRPGVGTTVTLLLPRYEGERDNGAPGDAPHDGGVGDDRGAGPPSAPADGPDDRPAIPLPADAACPAASRPGAPPGRAAPLTILLVEDDPRVLVATAGAVQELGHHVVACGNPRDAAGLMARYPDIGLILTDVLMPHQTGPEMVRELRARRPDVAVLFVTGYTGDTDTALLAGHGLLRKPFTITALDKAIADAVRRPARPAPRRAARAAARDDERMGSDPPG